MADLLPGTSQAIIAENIRTLRKQGFSELQATQKAHAFANGEDEHDEAGVDSEDLADGGSATDRQFVIVTKDFSGLGWAKKLLEEGETVTVATVFKQDDPKDLKQMKQVGSGWVDVLPLSEALSKLQTDTTYWIFAENHFSEEATKLREAGQRVFGASELSAKLEHDRAYGMEIAEDAGLPGMPSHEFSSREEGLSFLDENTDKAYVFKPDDGKFNYLTFVPIRQKDEDANREVYHYLAHMKEEPGTFILQERIPLEDSLEVNCEVWMFEGEPFLATLGLEVKRKNTYDLGEMCGCGGDFMQFIPLDSELVKQTVGKLLPFYKEQKYTGFADVNVIFTKDGVPHFLEVCNRFGYNSHPNMFLALALDGFGNIMADFIDGHVDGMRERFRNDVGASLTMFLDHPRPGLPVHIANEALERFYPFDGYTEDEDATWLLTGFSDEIGILMEHGPTIESVGKKLAESVAFDEAVSFPDMYYRWDLWKTDFYNAPALRMKELKKRGLL